MAHRNNAEPLILLGYGLVSGLRSTVLKGLQGFGASHPVGGENPISFCNVFFIAQSMVGLALLSAEPRIVWREIRTISPAASRAVAADSFLGCFLAPLAFYHSLDQLSVITQTLLFSLTLPASGFLALFWLKEKLPERFALSLMLIFGGLLIGILFGATGGMMSMDNWMGLAWGLVSVLATSLRNCIRRKIATYQLSRGLTVGVSNLAGALVFAIIAYLQYGPDHFLLLQTWWVFWVIVVYGITLSLGTEVLRQASGRLFSVSQVALAGSGSILVTVVSAAVVLGEPFTAVTALSLGLILAGVTQRFIQPRLASG
ncbi:DMT family transporter [Synechococcus sp. CS-1324]|uniref:DMT family transporter n=1 Tax=unclassified Synechococcus TaxID=2626047 RepID=UPI000DB8D6BA|nr:MULTISPECIES: DMT family transporter [unclassified Synechococcus]MCT0212181.1 DMT family transporter [Synechococcus sp. CS-1326]MCT0230446.1 DMT family transporter [Synechococcus sp. CS-1324]MCT0233378.1 DMT family transporter [Synechococcus sp. CS-1327]PZV03311.1 MAG: hypothetical protein DCF23_09970 [Cyanobium sp.]